MAAKIRKYGISALIGMIISLAVARHQGFAFAQAASLNARYLSDGFFVAAILLCGIGALTLISTTGFFDIFSYAFSSLLVLFTILRKPKDHPNFYDYKTIKAEKRGKPQAFLLLTGMGFLLAALLCWMLYYRL